MKILLIILTAMITSLSIASAAESSEDARYKYAVKNVNSMTKLAIFVKGAC